MRIIPAIDIIDGKCVRLSQGDYNQKTVYNENPLEVAKAFEAIGIKYLHLVDLDGAKSKRIVNVQVLEQICSQTNLKIDFGGGIKSSEDINIAFNSGAQQITAGSIAYSDPEKVQGWIAEFGANRIILGADVANNCIAINGWQTTTETKGVDFIRDYKLKGIQSVISTAIETDGMLSGPATDWYKSLIAEFPQLDIIASGGVSCMNDIKELDAIGCSGVIVGKALYEDKITIQELKNYVS